MPKLMAYRNGLDKATQSGLVDPSELERVWSLYEELTIAYALRNHAPKDECLRNKPSSKFAESYHDDYKGRDLNYWEYDS